MKPPTAAVISFLLLPISQPVCGASSDGAECRIYVAMPRIVHESVAEMIEVPWDELVNVVPEIKPGHIQLARELGPIPDPVVSQTVDSDDDGTPDTLIFQTDFREPSDSNPGVLPDRVVAHPDWQRGPLSDLFPAQIFRVTATDRQTRPPLMLVDGQEGPESLNEFAWENDRVAFRLFRPAQNPEGNTTVQFAESGVGIWGKRPVALVVDRWFRTQGASSAKHLADGRAFYEVGNSRGCGGTGIWRNGKLHVPQACQSARILASGPIRFIAEFTYAPWEVEGLKVSEVKRVTLDVGRNFNLTESTFTVHGVAGATGLVVGVGLALHRDRAGQRIVNAGGPWLLRWEDFGEHGGLGTAVIMDAKRFAGFASDDSNDLVLAQVQSGETLRFLNGFGWTESGQFPDRNVWEQHVAHMAKRWRTTAHVKVMPPSQDALPLRPGRP